MNANLILRSKQVYKLSTLALANSMRFSLKNQHILYVGNIGTSTLRNESTGSNLTHFDKQGQPKHVDISEKKLPDINSGIRIACASGYIQLNEKAFQALVENKIKKGNALIVAQIAGIQASKLTHMLIPLCHNILLDVCDIELMINDEAKRIHCQAICKTATSKTGVEMEALTACSISLLTVYDMCKAIQKDAHISEIKLNYKFGGKSEFKST